MNSCGWMFDIFNPSELGKNLVFYVLRDTTRIKSEIFGRTARISVFFPSSKKPHYPLQFAQPCKLANPLFYHTGRKYNEHLDINMKTKPFLHLRPE